MLNSFLKSIFLYLVAYFSAFEIKQEAQRATYRAPKYNVPPFWRIGQGGHLVFPIGQKNTNFLEDLKILLRVKIR